MSTQKRLTLAAATLLILISTAMIAADDRGPTTGHVLLLENDRVMEGDIERVGDQYRVRRHVGETWIPADQVFCLCADMKEAHQRLCARTNLGDPDERVRLARWCQLHGLRQQAFAEAAAAVELQPNNREAARLLRTLRRPVASPRPKSEQPEPEPEPGGPGLELDAASLGIFTTRVQPILMNACANCHASGKAPAFKLARVFADPTLNHRATQQNLASASAQINRERPLASPLLTHAMSVHGGADQPPLKGRQTAAYQSLEEWVRLTVSTVQPEPGDVNMASVPAQEFHPRTEVPAAKESPPPKNKRTSNVAAATKPTPAPIAPQPAAASDAAAPADPFDPAIYNREMHPERTTEEPKEKEK
jgi:hypothetical protein